MAYVHLTSDLGTENYSAKWFCELQHSLTGTKRLPFTGMARILFQFYNHATRIPVFHRSRQTGVSLIELLVACLIIGVLVQLAMPGFQALSVRSKRNATAQLLIADLNWSRTEALANSTRLYLCPGQNSDRCRSRADWSQGWSIFADQNRDGQLEPNELLLLRILPLNNSISVHFRKPGYLFYKNDGSAWPNGTFKICTAGSKVPPLLVIVYRTGRARTSTGTGLECIQKQI